MTEKQKLALELLGLPCESTASTPEIATGSLQIAVLDRGFVYVGTCSVTEGALVISDARNIRRWGTKKGLGELAENGPQSETKIDPAGTVRAPLSSVIHLIDCKESAWVS